MNNGIILFAHNSNQLDYGLLSIISGGLAKKYLNMPVSLISDRSTIDWMKTSGIYTKAEDIFDQIILTDTYEIGNKRTLNDGNTFETIPFINSDRPYALDLTPYDTTLLIDSDFLIFSDRLNQYWNVCEDVMISPGMSDLSGRPTGILDRYVSDTGVKMCWATNIMFKKNIQSKTFFDLVKHIKNHYSFYADLFRFNPTQYRNDISFSIAKHILDGFTQQTEDCLPLINTVTDKDILYDISNSSRLTFLLNYSEKFIASSIVDTDIHIMNKQSIIRHKENFLKLI